MKNVSQFGVATLLLICIVISSLGLLLGVFEIGHYDRVYHGVRVWGTDLGGMRRSESVELLSRKLAFLQREEFVFRDGIQVWNATAGQLGVSVELEGAVQEALDYGRLGSLYDNLFAQWEAFYFGFDIAPLIIFDQSQAEGLLEIIATGIDVEQRDAYITVDRVSAYVTPGQNGRTVNVRATADKLVQPLANFSGVDMDLVVDEIPAMIVDAAEQSLIAENILNNQFQFSIESPRVDDPESWIIDRSTLAEMLVIRHVEEGQTQYEVGLDQHRMLEFLRYVASQLYIAPENARFTFDESSQKFEILKSAVPGRALNVNQTLQKVNTELSAGGNSVAFYFDVIPPEVEDDAMASDMGIFELVSSSRSFFRGSGDARLNNIAVGGATMHGVLVAPGELFSFNSFLGDVSLDTGFAEAWIIFGGRTIQGVGGGICQVSTTVYRAALFGGYPIDERNPHAYRVAYYEQGDDSPGPGLDATVFKPIADFQFTNDRDAWLLINVEIDEDAGWITFRFFSTDDGRSVTVDPPLVSNVVEPDPPIYEENPDLETGIIEQVDWAASGADVSVYRVIQRNGEVLFDEEIVTRYQPWQAVYQYGIGTQLPQDAIP